MKYLETRIHRESHGRPIHFALPSLGTIGIAPPMPARDGGLRAWAKAFVVDLRMRLAQRAEARAIRMTAHELDELSDDRLRDIGLIRGSIESALREHASQGRGIVRR